MTETLEDKTSTQPIDELNERYSTLLKVQRFGNVSGFWMLEEFDPAKGYRYSSIDAGKKEPFSESKYNINGELIE